MKVYMNNVGLLIKYDSLNAAEMEQLDIVARKYCKDNSLKIVVHGDKYHVTGPAAGLYEILYRLSNVCDIELV